MLKYNNNLTLSKGGLDIGLKVGILAEIGYMLHECAVVKMFMVMSLDVFSEGDKERMLQQHVLLIFTVDQDQGCRLPSVTHSNHVYIQLTNNFHRNL